MKKVIEGKVYNTETAEELHDWSNHYPCSDFKACSESLYRTKKGAFFIAGSGGPLSSYAVPCGGGTGGSEGIRPVSREEALEWLESHGGEEAIEEHFSDMVEEA